jgi:undecaprenyl-diphosphatase
VAAEPDHRFADTAVDVLGGTPRSFERPAVDPATFALPAPLAQRVRAFDASADAWFERWRGNPVADRVFFSASALGDFSLLWHLAGTVDALRGHERRTVRLVAALGVETVLINGVVKSLFRRDRPDWDQHRPHKLRKPLSSSFPSGHATSGFMAATLLGAGRSRPTKVAWYGVAAVVAASRVHVKIHHASDVVGGAAIGLGLGAAVKRLWRE